MRLLFILLLSGTICGQNAQWQNFGPSQSLETSAKLCQDGEGNLYYLANGAVNQFPGTKWQLYKFNNQGQQLWKKIYGRTGNISASQILMAGKKLYVVGERTWNDTSQAFLSVIDTAGTLIQEKFWGADTVVVGQDLAWNGQNQLALLNQIRVQPSLVQGSQVIILDTNLQEIARHSYIDTLSFVAQEIVNLPSGGWVYTSDYELPNRFDLLLIKINQQGAFEKRTIISNGYTRGGNAIALNSKNQIIIGGEGASAFSVNFDISLSILDSNLNLISDVNVRPGVPKNDAAFDMAVSPYNTYLFTGYRIAPESGETEMIVVESDSAGNVLFLDHYASSSTCIGSGIICDQNGDFTASGTDFNSTPSLILARGSSKGLAKKEFKISKIDLYPNPSSGRFLLSKAIEANALKIYNSSGVEVNFKVEGRNLTIEAAAGVYHLMHKHLGHLDDLIIAP